MNVPLPPFPEKLQESIAKGLVYNEQAHTQRMNDFLKAHVRNITKDSYPTCKEYDVLKCQVTSRLRTQKLPNVEVYEVGVLLFECIKLLTKPVVIYLFPLAETSYKKFECQFEK